MRRLLIFLVLGATAVTAGCTGRGAVGYTATATYASPDLAYVQPGVYVVADYNEPVFYTQGAYWRFHNGLWYRSPYYNRGWTYYARPPRVLRSIDRPYAYVRYRPSQRYRVDRGTIRSQGGVRVRDHRRGYRDPRYRRRY